MTQAERSEYFYGDEAMKMLADLDTQKGAGLINCIKQEQDRPTERK